MKNRIIALFLTIIMVITLLPTFSFATASNDYTQWKQGDAEWNQAPAWPVSQYPNATAHYMSEAGCLVTSVAMLLRHYNVVTESDVNKFNPWLCNEALKAAGAFDTAADMYWAGPEKAYPGFKYVGVVSYSQSKLVELYNQGYACIVKVNGSGGYYHYVAVKNASSSGVDIMDPGSSATSLSHYSSKYEIRYYKTTAHTCDKGTYMYYEAAHPHYSCYKCSVCGKIWADSSSSNYVVSCDRCRPGKPVLTSPSGTYKEGDTISFTWNGTNNTTHYNIWVYKKNADGEWPSVNHTFYVNSGMTLDLDAGEYKALLISYDSDHWEEDRSDWVHTYGDEVYFTVSHDYSSTVVPATCTEPAYVIYTCDACGDSYREYMDDGYSEWSTTYPSGVDEELIESKTQYRYSDYETTTSYSTSLPGYTQLSSTWERSGSGTVEYVKSWPAGFNTSHSLYGTYNKSPKSNSETATDKTTVNSNYVSGYIYYHWCRGNYTDGPINRATSKNYSSEFCCFHAFYSTTPPSSLTPSPDGDGSYINGNSSCCKDSHWYYPVEVYTQTYTTYKKLFTYEKWSDWSDWSDSVYTSSDTRKVETQTVYRYMNSNLVGHDWGEGTVLTEASCTESGSIKYTCSACGETKTEVIPALGHAFESGTCTHCGAADPDWREINLSVGSISATVGETVTIPVTVSNNSGFAGFTLSIEYDAAALKLTAIGKGDILSTTDSGMFTPNVEGNIIQYTNTQDVTAEGTLLYLTFTVLDGAAGKSNDVAVSVKDGVASNFVNEDAKNVNVIAQKGSIEAVALTPIIQEGKLSVSNERARPGEEVTVSISIEENPGIMVMILGIDYDRNKLELIGFENAGLTGWTVNKNAVWIGDEDSTYNGVILKLKFKVLDDVEEGDVAVSLMFSAGDIANHNEEAIMPISEAGKITVYTSIAGDLNGDGIVNALDLLRLKKALSGEETELLGSADVNGDGNVNALDLLRLKKYLSGDDVTLVR